MCNLNIKRKLANKPILQDDGFEALASGDDVSNIRGSDSESEQSEADAPQSSAHASPPRGLPDGAGKSVAFFSTAEVLFCAH